MEFKMAGFKKAVVSSAIARYAQLLQELSGRFKSVTTTHDGAASAYVHVKPPRMEAIEEISLLSSQIQMANHEFEVLRKMEGFVDHLHTFIELGALVLTSRGAYFVAANLDPFPVNGRLVTGIPVQSPFYHAMKGKREGEHFAFKRLDYQIKEIL